MLRERIISLNGTPQRERTQRSGHIFKKIFKIEAVKCNIQRGQIYDEFRYSQYMQASNLISTLNVLAKLWKT